MSPGLRCFRLSVNPVHPRQHQQAEIVQAVVVISALARAQGRMPEGAEVGFHGLVTEIEQLYS